MDPGPWTLGPLSRSSTLDPRPSTLNPGPWTLRPFDPSTLRLLTLHPCPLTLDPSTHHLSASIWLHRTITQVSLSPPPSFSLPPIHTAWSVQVLWTGDGAGRRRSRARRAFMSAEEGQDKVELRRKELRTARRRM
eukprot:3255222-Rhodomonas_salina.1